MRRPVALAGVLTLTVVLGACGSSADTSETAPSAAPSQAPSRSQGPSQSPSATTPPVTPPPATPATPPATTPPATPDETAAAPQVPDELDFTAATVDGGTFDGADLAGRPAVLWFWAPWCPVCQREADVIADLAAEYDGEVTFVGVAGLSGDLAAMEDFVADGGVDGIVHIDDRSGEVYSRFGVTQQYDIGFVSADGAVDIATGPLDESEIVARVEALATG